MNGLEQLIPQPSELTVAGEILVMTPLKIGQLPPFLRAVAPAMQSLTRPDIDWLALFGAHGDELLSAIAIAVGKPRGWVDDLGPDEAILLAARVIEVNADFFSRAVIPKLALLFERIKPLAQEQGNPTSGSTASSA